jgi:hypothetical protein
MENVNENPIAEEAVVEDAPVVESTEVISEEPKIEEAPVEHVEVEVVEEAKVEEPTAVRTNDFGRSTSEPQALSSVVNGVMGVSTAPKPEPKAPKKSAKKTEDQPEKVAIHSTRNVTWEGVGKVYRGYNIVSQEAADKWVTRSHIRIATPEEVAKEFGK